MITRKLEIRNKYNKWKTVTRDFNDERHMNNYIGKLQDNGCKVDVYMPDEPQAGDDIMEVMFGIRR